MTATTKLLASLCSGRGLVCGTTTTTRKTTAAAWKAIGGGLGRRPFVVSRNNNNNNNNNNGVSAVAAAAPVGSSSRATTMVRRCGFSSLGGGGGGFPATTIDFIGFDWADRFGMQDHFTPEEKGWAVSVEWRPTEFGVGLFAKQDIPKGTVIRRGISGVNLKEFSSAGDIEEFCRSDGNGGDGNGDADDRYDAKIRYVQDYLFAFYKDTDERKCSVAAAEASVDDDVDVDDDRRFFGLWVPGCGINHSPVPNIVCRWNSEIDSGGIDVLALVDISEDDEIVIDYHDYGKSPASLRDWATKHGVTLTFADCNDFVL